MQSVTILRILKLAFEMEWNKMNWWQQWLTYIIVRWILCNSDFASRVFANCWNQCVNHFFWWIWRCFAQFGGEASSWTALSAWRTRCQIGRCQNIIVVIVFRWMFFVHFVVGGAAVRATILTWRSFFEWSATWIWFGWRNDCFLLWIEIAVQNIDQFNAIFFFNLIQFGNDFS